MSTTVQQATPKQRYYSSDFEKKFFMIATASVCDWALQSPAHLANKDAMRRRKLQMKIGLERTLVLQNKEPPPISMQ